MKKILVLFIFTILVFTSCVSKTEKTKIKKEKLTRSSALLIQNYIDELKTEEDKKLDDYIKALPLEYKIAQLFIENLEGNTAFRSYETFDKITGKAEDSKNPVIAGGYLFFSPNLCDSFEDQKKFVQSIYDYSDKYNQLHPFLATDEEGGYVNRLKKLTGGLPSEENVANQYSVTQAYDLYASQAKAMKELGFTLNLAPVLEICTDDNKDFLDGRSFGSLEKVLQYGKIAINAYENNRVAVVVKHFPGNTNTDPHTGLPYINLSFEDFNSSIQGFIQLLDYKPEALLMSHAIVSCIDSKTPSCFSYELVTKTLREKYNYEGIIFSDDIFMGALIDNGYTPEKACVLAILSGVDCIMISEKRFAKPAKVLYEKALQDSSFEDRINESLKRLLKFKIKHGLLSL